MSKVRFAIAGLLSLFAINAALAQSSAPPTLSYHSVYGRLGATPGDSGPGQAISFATLLAQIGGVQSANTVWAGPTSGSAAVPTWRALIGADLPVPSASTLGGVQSLTCPTSNWFNTLSTAGVFGCSQPAFSDISGVATGAQLPNPSASTLGGVKSLASITHQYLTSIGTNGLPTQAQPACGDLSDATYCNSTVGQLAGTTTNNNASSGNIGEYISSVIASGSAVSLTTNTNANVTSISLTAGDWDVSGFVAFVGGSTTTVAFVTGSISLTSGTIDTSADRQDSIFYNSATIFTTLIAANTITGPSRFSLSGTTTVFLIARAGFGTSTCSAYGTIRARRVR
jgi:hypothetical protein